MEDNVDDDDRESFEQPIKFISDDEPTCSKFPTNTDNNDVTLKNQSKKTFYRKTSSRALKPIQIENNRNESVPPNPPHPVPQKKQQSKRLLSQKSKKPQTKKVKSTVQTKTTESNQNPHEQPKLAMLKP